jgi:hypothetical protein
MSPEAQRIAIAKACGRVQRPDGFWFPKGANYGSQGIPDYLNDLNAMHEAEKILTHEQRIDHMEWLGMCSDDYGYKAWAYVHADAAQRAEAFLRTIGKWENTAAKEDQP